MPSTYKQTTYAEVARWLEDSKVKYRANPKSGKSFDRYAAYEKAKTIGESLQRGSKPEDLLFDYEHGHLQVLGPFRPKPLDIYEVKDFEKLTYTDMVLCRFTSRVDLKRKVADQRVVQDKLEESIRNARAAKKRLTRLAVAKSFGVSDVDQLGEKRGHWESEEVFAHRSVAETEARAVLDMADKHNRRVSDFEMLRVLRLWGFRQNETRKNVMQNGQTWIYSDTVGVVADRTGRMVNTEQCRLYPFFCRLLSRYIIDHQPEDLDTKFVWTSVNINKNYAGRLHRDAQNVGPSFIKAFGDFTGGNLAYYPEDDRSMHLHDIKQMGRSAAGGLSLNLKSGLLLFDGKRGHEVESFKGERYSLVYFTAPRFWKLPAEQRKVLIGHGINFPTKPAMARLLGILPPPRGILGGQAVAKKKLAAGRSASVKLAVAKSARWAKKNTLATAGYRFWPHSDKAKVTLERNASKQWAMRPPPKLVTEMPSTPPMDGTSPTEGRRVSNGPSKSKKMLQTVHMKRKDTDNWHSSWCASIGQTVCKHKELVLEGPQTCEDAVIRLNGKDRIPNAITKAGVCAVWSKRTKVHYMMWSKGNREKAHEFWQALPPPKRIKNAH